ncbi:hypothetical protein OG21DRAFT_191580 [Imleria badia]|nr:hypothetical protein OG21DRAFT_191580 [Imleria badia]
MHDEAAIPLSGVEGDSQQSTPAESHLEHVPLPMQTPPLLPEARAASQPQPARLSSRFSTVMSTHSRQTFIIDISDDDEEEEEEEPAQNASDNGPNSSIAPSGSPVLASTPVPQSSPEQQTTALQSTANLHADMSLSRPQLEHDVDPPFMTDGRGRVVWSSTRNTSGRGTAAEGRAPRHLRTGSAPRMTCPSPSSTLVVPNTRGHAWGGQDSQGIDGKVGGGEQGGDMD